MADVGIIFKLSLRLDTGEPRKHVSRGKVTVCGHLDL